MLVASEVPDAALVRDQKHLDRDFQELE